MAYSRSFKLFLLFWALLCQVQASAQLYKVSGRIVDAETLEPLPYAHVFIDQTTIGAVSDFNGEYVIENLSPGDYKLVFSFVGYELYYKVATINDKDARVSARLIPQKELLQNVEVKGTRDKQWESQLRQFTRVFFGDNEFADGCKILNPWVLDFDYDKSTKKFKATASAPLEIENRSLGYTVMCNLQGFIYDSKSYRINGLYRFDEINTIDPKEAVRWTRNRRQAYQNSLRFLMKSIVEQHAPENGFTLYLDNRPDVYTSHTGLFSSELDKKNVVPIKLEDIVRPSGQPGYYLVSLDKRIEVHHTTQFARTKTYRDVPNPVSWVEVEKREPLLVSNDGFIVNNGIVVTSGDLNKNRISSMLPLNYTPGSFVVVNYLTKRNVAKRLQERVLIQTDKSIYYPGENIWVKAHINYANQSIKDSLSHVLYADLMDEKANIVQSKILKIDTTGARAEFLIGDGYIPGNYYLRAYTLWMQNYGLSLINYIPIVIGNPQQRLNILHQKSSAEAEDFIWTIQSEVQGDSTRLLLAIDSAVHSENAMCAVSIAPFAFTSSEYLDLFKERLVFDADLPQGALQEFIYPIEYNFNLNGKITDGRRHLVQGDMTAIRGKMDSLYNFKTDKRGFFKIEHLDFYDSAVFAFQARNRKGRIFARTEVLPRPKPEILIPKQNSIGQLDTTILQESLNLIPPKLDTAIVKQEVLKESPGRSNFYADYILTANDLENFPSGQSIISALQGRIPGLQYSANGRSVSFRNKNFSNDEKSEPLFVVDGVPLFSQQGISEQKNETTQQRQNQQEQASKETTTNSQEAQVARQTQVILGNQSLPAPNSGGSGSTLDMLSHLTVSSVSRVEVSSRIDPRYGSMGTNGVIAIYTKKVQGKSSEVKTFDTYSVQGFSRPAMFKQAVNYSGNPFTEYTPTWYWNPDLLISAKHFTEIKFPSLPKGVVFKVTIAGITQSGEPVTGSFLLNAGGTKPLSASLDQRQK